MLKKTSAIVLTTVLFLAGCAGRSPNPVQTVQSSDVYLKCGEIVKQIEINNHKVEHLSKERGWKTVQNVAAGVGGLFIPVLWFGMDLMGTTDIEARALQDRQEYLSGLAQQKECK